MTFVFVIDIKGFFYQNQPNASVTDIKTNESVTHIWWL